MPDWLPEIRARLAAARLDPPRELEIAQELSLHLDDRYAELLKSGIPAAEARRLALDELREDARMREQLARIEPREAPRLAAGDPSGAGWLSSAGHDVRYAFRLLRAHGWFTILAVVTLAVGIGSTTAIYAVVDNVLLRPIGYHDADRIARVFETDPSRPGQLIAASYASFEEWQKRSRTLRFAIYTSARGLTLLEGEPERISASVITPEFFAVNGVMPALGRAFTPADGEPGAPPVMILSHAAWHRRFGGDPGVLGRVLRTSAGAHTIVGVLPPTSFFFGGSSFWLPFQRPTTPAAAAARAYPVLARRLEGVTPEQARDEMDAIARALASGRSSTAAGVAVVPVRELTVGHLRATLYTLLGAVGCILVIACVNVAGLLVARGESRTREIAVRVALGASRWRIARQLITESVILGAIGGGLGVLLAWWSTAALLSLLPVALPAVNPVAVDGRVLTLALAASILTGILFGAAPALRLSRTAAAAPRDESHQFTSRWVGRTGPALVLIEVALCLVLLTGAGLMVRTLVALYSVDPGIEPRGVLALNATPVLTADAQLHRAVAFYDELVARVDALPGVHSAAAINTAPFSLSTSFAQAIARPGGAPQPISPRSITPAYFTTMGIPLVAGRDFGATDREGGTKVIVVNTSAAQRLWPGESPIGKELRLAGAAGPGDPHHVVGVVGDVRHQGLDRAILNEVYFPHAQKPDADMTVVARAADTQALATLAAAQLRGLPEQAVMRPATTFDAMIGRLTQERRNRALLLGIVSTVGLLLASVGVFGATAYSVTRRTREIGIRMALGATRMKVIGTVVGALLPAILIGVALGLFGAWGATRTLSSFLYGVQPTDTATFAGAASLLIVIALLACYVPARRALRVDPVVALRQE